MTRKLLVFILNCIIVFLFASCTNIDVGPFESRDYIMGTLVIQRIYHKEADRIHGEVNERIAGIEAKMTINKPGGEINLLNDAAGEDYVVLGDDTLYVLDKARHFSDISNGVFDVTVGPLVKTWGIWSDNPRVPGKNEIDELLKLVNYKDVLIEKDNDRAMLKKSRQVVDVGGIAKGYAADEAIRIYKENGVKSAFVSLGGNVAVLGGKPDGSPWRIGIRNPKGPRDSYIGIVSIKDGSVVSSGEYERFFEEKGVRYHHILDPKTGFPAESDLAGVTIVSDLSIDADALSTAVFVLGLEDGMRLIEGI
ncbi:MAG TPA: FAD:protein FMN transferase, partial [Acetivibrio sp.]|nr:FAD:protein FMN transferase [Acetivibrio sp.]